MTHRCAAAVPPLLLLMSCSASTAAEAFSTHCKNVRCVPLKRVLPALTRSQEVAPHMMRQRGGLIVMIGSVTAHMSSPFAGAYSASKAALLGLTDSLRLELQPFGVQVSYVTAGSIK